MVNFNKYQIKKGFYHSVDDVDIYIPSSSIFIKDNTDPEEGLHDGHYHYLGICPYKDFYKVMDYIDYNGIFSYINEYHDLNNDYVLFSIKDANDNNQFNCVTPEEFNKVCDFTKYCIVSFKDGNLEVIRKIKHINSVSDIEVIDAQPNCLDRWSVNLYMLFFSNRHKHLIITKKNNIVNMYYKQMVYNALTSMRIPCNKSFNKNINFEIIKTIYDKCISDISTISTENVKLYDELIHFKKYIKYGE
jgi:hypothetical protein